MAWSLIRLRRDQGRGRQAVPADTDFDTDPHFDVAWQALQTDANPQHDGRWAPTPRRCHSTATPAAPALVAYGLILPLNPHMVRLNPSVRRRLYPFHLQVRVVIIRAYSGNE